LFDAFAPPKAKHGSADFPTFDVFEQPKTMPGRCDFPLLHVLSQPEQSKASNDFQLLDPFPQEKGKGPENEEEEAKGTFSSFGDIGDVVSRSSTKWRHLPKRQSIPKAELDAELQRLPSGSSVRSPPPSSDSADLLNFTLVVQELTALVATLDQELELLASANAAVAADTKR
jgi:hypothetical protein